MKLERKKTSPCIFILGGKQTLVHGVAFQVIGSTGIAWGQVIGPHSVSGALCTCLSESDSYITPHSYLEECFYYSCTNMNTVMVYSKRAQSFVGVVICNYMTG